jgi:hypothetical protein
MIFQNYETRYMKRILRSCAESHSAKSSSQRLHRESSIRYRYPRGRTRALLSIITISMLVIAAVITTKHMVSTNVNVVTIEVLVLWGAFKRQGTRQTNTCERWAAFGF